MEVDGQVELLDRQTYLQDYRWFESEALKGPLHLNDIVPTRVVGIKTRLVSGSGYPRGPTPKK